MANVVNTFMVPGVVQTITLSTSSVAISNAFGSRTRYVRLASGADGSFYTVAASPTATTSMNYLPPNTIEIIRVAPSQKIAAISTGSPSSKVTVTELK